MARTKDMPICQICGQQFSKLFLLRVHLHNRHKVTDPNLKVHKCREPGCVFTCPTGNGLKTHTLKHSTHDYSCKLCNKTFKRLLGYENHNKRYHSSTQSFICEHCGQSFPEQSQLNVHMRRHADVKPFSCDKCSYSTFHKSCLKSHMFTQHKILMDFNSISWKCQLCKFTTDKKCVYSDHVKMHENIRDMPCTYCGKMFATKKTLRQHKIKVHKVKNIEIAFFSK